MWLGACSMLPYEGDFLRDVDWSDASVVFANAVTWPRLLLQEVARRVDGPKPHERSCTFIGQGGSLKPRRACVA